MADPIIPPIVVEIACAKSIWARAAELVQNTCHHDAENRLANASVVGPYRLSARHCHAGWHVCPCMLARTAAASHSSST